MSRIAPAADTGLPSAIHAIGHPMLRRGFLAGLAALPLIGGSVALLGKPSAVAEPVTTEMLEAYKTWLFYERRWLAWEMAGDPIHQQRYRNFAPPDDRVALSDNIQDCFLFVGPIRELPQQSTVSAFQAGGSRHEYRRMRLARQPCC